MEDLLGFLIIAAGIIISIISSVSKNKKKSNAAVPQPDSTQDTEKTENINTEPEQIRGTVDSNDMTVEEKVKQIKEKKYSNYEKQKEKEQKEKQEQEDEYQNQQELDEEYSETTKEEHTTSKDKEQVANERSQQKAKRKTPKKNTEKKSRIEEIQENFDVEKGILYSEILNKKHF